MKKFVFALLLLSLSASAQDLFYMYGDKRIPLQCSNNQIVLTTKNNEGTLPFIQELNTYGKIHYALTETGGFITIERNNNSSYNDLIDAVRNSNLVQTYSSAYLCKGSEIPFYCIGEVVVLLSPANKDIEIDSIIKEYGYHIKEEDPFVKGQYVISIDEMDGSKTLDAANLLYTTGLFEFAEPNFLMDNSFSTSDPLFQYQWGLKNTGQNGGTIGTDINVESAWNFTLGSPNIVVAVVDNGIQLNHPDLAGNLILGYDATGNGTAGGPLNNSEKHGTACAGIIGASHNNTMVAGVAPSCKMMPIHISYGNYYTNAWLAEGINYAVTHGADVISNSWGGGPSNSAIDNAINNAIENGRNGKGCFVVFSSGNNNHSEVEYPSSTNGVIAVGGVDRCGQRSGKISITESPCDPWPEGSNVSPGSSYGSKLSVVAPGTNVYTTTTGGTYRSDFGGTSSACPHVAGVAALMLSINPHLTSSQVKTIIESTASKVGNYSYSPYPFQHPNGTWNVKTGYGMVNAGLAVQWAQSLNPYADLFMRDNVSDNGFEPNISTSVWSNTPDIWITDMNGNIVTSPKCGKKYWVHYFVTNKSNISSNNTTLNLRWTIASSAPTWRNNWYSAGTLCGRPKCGAIVSSINLGNIPAYGTKEDSVLWTAPIFESMTCVVMPGKTWNLAICGVLDDGNLTSGLNNTNLSMDVFTSQNNNVVWKNFSLINAIDEVYMAIAEDPFIGGHHFDFSFAPNNPKDGEKLSQNINIYIKMSDELFAAWQEGGMKGEGIEIRDGHTLKLNTPKARLGNIYLENGVDYPFAIYVAYKDFAMLDTPIEWEMTQLCYENDEVDSVVSSTVLYIDLNEPKKIDVRANENTLAFAGDVVGFIAESEELDAVFTWYNTVGDTIGIGDAITITPTASQQVYLEGYSSSVGAYGYDTVTVTVRRAAITALTPNPANNQTIVSYRLASDVTSASIVIANATGQVLYSAPLDVTQTTHTVNLQAIPTGQYTVRIESLGSPLDAKTLIVY